MVVYHQHCEHHNCNEKQVCGRRKTVGNLYCYQLLLLGFLLKASRPNRGYGNSWSHEPLLQEEVEEVEDDGFDSGDIIENSTEDDKMCHSPFKISEEILMERAQNGLICRDIPVKETHKVVRKEDENGNKMVNVHVLNTELVLVAMGKWYFIEVAPMENIMPLRFSNFCFSGFPQITASGFFSSLLLF